MARTAEQIAKELEEEGHRLTAEADEFRNRARALLSAAAVLRGGTEGTEGTEPRRGPGRPRKSGTLVPPPPPPA